MKSRSPGFTLIEMVMYTAFVGMIMVSMTLLASTAFTVRSKLRASLILEQNVRFALLRVTTLVAEASGVSTPSLGATGGTLVLAMPVAAQNPTTITTTGGVVTITQGSTGTAQVLTSSEVSFSSLSFARVSSTSPMVRIVMTAGLRNAPASYGSLTVTTTAAVRR